MPPPRRVAARPLASARTRDPERQVAFRTGISAESRAAAFLIAKGFRILARRYRTPVGEIDIVARRRKLLIFVEVKAREKLRRRRVVGHRPAAGAHCRSGGSVACRQFRSVP